MAKRKEQETLHDQRSPKRTRWLRSSFSLANSPTSCSPCLLRLSPRVAISDSSLSATLSPKQHSRAEDLPASLPSSPDSRRPPDERRGSIERARSSLYRHQFGPLFITATVKREARHHHPLKLQHVRHHHGGVVKPTAKCGKPKLKLQPLNPSRDPDWYRDDSLDERPASFRPYPSPSAVAAAALGGCVQMWVCCGCERDNGTDAVWCTNATCKHYTVNCLDCFSY